MDNIYIVYENLINTTKYLEIVNDNYIKNYHNKSTLNVLEVIKTNDVNKQDIIMNYLQKYDSIRFIGNGFNIGTFPTNIKKLEFYQCDEFNMDNLPTNLKELSIHDHTFNQLIDNLPYGLEKLYLNECFDFNKPLNNLPPNLKALSIIGDCFNQSLDYLPSGLEQLFVYCYEYEQSLLNLPNSITSLKLIMNIECIDKFILLCPSNLEELEINVDIDLNNIPESIEHLHLSSSNSKLIYKLPANLKQITFGYNYYKYNNENYDRIQNLIKAYENNVKCINIH